MVLATLTHNLERIGLSLGMRTLALATMGACTYAGYLLHELVQKTRFDGVAGEGASMTLSTVKALFAMDATIATILVPALIVGGLALGGMYVWTKRDG